MNPQRGMVLGALAIVAVVVGCWMTLLAPKRTQISAVEAQITQAQSRATAANAVVAQATQARAAAERDATVLARLTKAVPEDDDVGPLVRQLDAIARANKIDFRSAKLVAGTAAAPAAPPTPPAPTPEGKDAKPADAGTGAPVAAVVTQPPPGTVVGEAGLLTVPFSFTFDGGYKQMERFLAAVHGLAKTKRGQISVRGRLITIDGFSLGAGRNGFPKVTAEVSATAYLLPVPTAATTATTAPPTATLEAK